MSFLRSLSAIYGASQLQGEVGSSFSSTSNPAGPSAPADNDTGTMLTRFSFDVSRAFDAIAKIEILDGILLEDLALTTTATDFDHKLGRTWRGAHVVRKDANVDIWFPTQTDDTRYITIDASGSTTASLWVF